MKFKPCECGSELFYMRQNFQGMGNFLLIQMVQKRIMKKCMLM